MQTANRLNPAKFRLVIFITLFWICHFPWTSASAENNEPETIQWRVIDWPPVYILDGPLKGKGTGDELITLISKHLSEYSHERVIMSNARFDAQIQKGHKILNVTGLPAPHLINSIPTSIILPPHIIIRKDRIDEANPPKCFSLDDILSESGLIGGITKGRYGPGLNAVVNPHQHHPWIHQSPNYIDHIRMLYAGRIDYTIEYPSIVRYFEMTHEKMQVTTAVPICELSKSRPYVTGHVLCPKTDWGEKMVERINRIIKEERKTKTYRSMLLRWASEENLPRYNGYLDELFSQ